MRRTSRASASMQRHHGSWSRSFQMVLVRSATTGERCTFWPPPLLWTLRLGATAARRVLSNPFPSACACHVPFYYLHRVLAAASPLRAAPFPANACVSFPPQTARFSAHRCWLLPKSTVGEMCLAPPPWSPARPTSRVLWWPAGGNLQRMQARKRYRMICAPRLTRCTDDCRSALAPSPPPAPTLP